MNCQTIFATKQRRVQGGGIIKKQTIGFILFLVYLFLSVIDFVFVLGMSSVTRIEELIRILGLSSQIGLVSKLIVLAMFGLLFTSSVDE